VTLRKGCDASLNRADTSRGFRRKGNSRIINQNWPIEPVSLDDEEKAKQIIRRYTDKTFSYTDAASFAVMERLGV
jgi:hypothetical protein